LLNTSSRTYGRPNVQSVRGAPKNHIELYLSHISLPLRTDLSGSYVSNLPESLTMSDADQHSEGIITDTVITTVLKTGAEIHVWLYDPFVIYDS